MPPPTIGAIVGAGTMDLFIGQVTAMSVLRTRECDGDSVPVGRAESRVHESLEKLVPRTRITLEQREFALGLLEFSFDFDGVGAGEHSVVEAVSGSLELKQEVFSRLEHVGTRNSIFASKAGNFGAVRGRSG